MTSRKLIHLHGSFSPFANLAIEEYLFYNNNKEYLLIYKNNPCLVYGNFQNPFKEFNFEKVIENGLTYARRFSGGGTVYHDLGNLNLSFISNNNDKTFGQKKIIQILDQYLGNESCFELTGHGDILIKYKDNKYKVSGSGFRQSRNRLLHHFTLLVDTDLKQLKGTLSPTFEEVYSLKGVDSRPQPVINLGQVDSKFLSLEMDLLDRLKKNYFYTDWNKYKFELNLDEIHKIIQKNKSFDFKFKKCCDFSFSETLASGESLTGVIEKGSLKSLLLSKKESLIQNPYELKRENLTEVFNALSAKKGELFTDLLKPIISKLFIYID